MPRSQMALFRKGNVTTLENAPCPAHCSIAQAIAERHQKLREELAAARQAEASSFGQLDVVVREADRSQSGERPQRDPDEPVGQVHPEDRRQDDAEQDQKAAHRRRAGLRKMRLGSLGSNQLADLAAFQKTNHGRTQRQREEERGHGRRRRAKRDVAKDVEGRNAFREGIEQMVKHRTYSPFTAASETPGPAEPSPPARARRRGTP